MSREATVLQVLGRSAGGIARHVAQVVAALDGHDGLRIDVAGPGDLRLEMPKPVLPLDIPDGVTGHRAAIGALRSLLLDGRYDVVHAHGLRAGIDAALAARGGRVRVLLTVHNLVRSDVTGLLRAPLYRWAEPLAMLGSARTFAVSDDIARRLARRLPPARGRIEVLHLGVGEAPEVRRRRAEVRAELGLEDAQPLVVTAARLAPQKALPVMLTALSRLPAHVVLAVLGEGPLEDALRQEAAEIGVGGRVRWLGFRRDLADFLAAAEIFCLSSSWEGVPLAAQEAILLGTPVVATAVGGMGELIEDGVSGRLVPKGDPGALAGALAETLASSEVRDRYAEAARARLRAAFSTDRMLERLVAVYRESTARA